MPDLLRQDPPGYVRLLSGALKVQYYSVYIGVTMETTGWSIASDSANLSIPGRCKRRRRRRGRSGGKWRRCGW